jgi:hypothetical protein
MIEGLFLAGGPDAARPSGCTALCHRESLAAGPLFEVGVLWPADLTTAWEYARKALCVAVMVQIEIQGVAVIPT